MLLGPWKFNGKRLNLTRHWLPLEAQVSFQVRETRKIRHINGRRREVNPREVNGTLLAGTCSGSFAERLWLEDFAPGMIGHSIQDSVLT